MEFLKLGADPTLKDVNGQTVLHLAANSDRVGVFAYFYCTLSLDPFVRDINDYTPLHLAVLENNENMSSFLISITNDLEMVDNKGYTPLHLTVLSSSYKIAKNLVMRGANRNAKCKFGQTPEQLAMSLGRNDMIKVLVKFI
jgi:ankyrin repeat protein